MRLDTCLMDFYHRVWLELKTSLKVKVSGQKYQHVYLSGFNRSRVTTQPAVLKTCSDGALVAHMDEYLHAKRVMRDFHKTQDKG